ncbi:MAG TPA: HlyD family secretion protein [Bryobacteraceae bacterium]|nr:HlyD family secretion protein [Bryobacteraceae bacterium]
MTLELEQETLPEQENLKPAEKNNRKAAGAPKPAGRLKALLITGGFAVVVAAGTGAYLHFQNRVSTDDAQVDAHNAPIAPKISGNIVEILVDDNQLVRAGQALVRIDPRDYQAKVDQARAALAVAESQSVGAHAGVPLADGSTASAMAAAESQLAAAVADSARAKADYERASTSELAYAQADVDSKRATKDRAQADLARMRPLVDKDEISKLQYDSYLAAARVADSDLKASQENLANAQKKAESSQASMQTAEARANAARADLQQARVNRQQVKISSAQAGSASAAIQQARANLEAAELQLSYANIVAPIDGLATKKTIQLGQIVQPGQTLLTIVPLKHVWVTANFKETQLANVRPGQRAEVSVDMYGRSFEGQVDSIAGASGAALSLLPPENATGNYVKVVQRIPVKILLRDPPPTFVFRPGMNVDATIFTK